MLKAYSTLSAALAKVKHYFYTVPLLLLMVQSHCCFFYFLPCILEGCHHCRWNVQHKFDFIHYSYWQGDTWLFLLIDVMTGNTGSLRRPNKTLLKVNKQEWAYNISLKAKEQGTQTKSKDLSLLILRQHYGCGKKYFHSGVSSGLHSEVKDFSKTRRPQMLIEPYGVMQ